MKAPRHARRVAIGAGLAVLLGGLPAAGGPVLLVIEAARDTTAGFVALPLPELGRRALAWPDGVVTLPDTTEWLEEGPRGLAFRLESPSLVGVAAGGRFACEPGSYRLDAPLVLADGAVVACLSAGSLDVTGERITYRQPPARRDQRGNYLILAGLLIATAVMLRGVRRRHKSA
ncbi:MAG TPA: hypothetical protein PLL30_08260 [Candidatus Krumholzibacteria bacterium]|nr:hypothetical protein [Candidatus Krumholzibacteria bacterium]HPD71750.1 hypothetical protein [Candidatus Krumholzibacteria bacterium]HRY41317.1 hypothetical protein [Candidatus Krumholzibacteria bacterium]